VFPGKIIHVKQKKILIISLIFKDIHQNFIKMAKKKKCLGHGRLPPKRKVCEPILSSTFGLE
jgi:hypothetical protein